MDREVKFRAWLEPRWDDDEEAFKMYYDIQNSYDTLGDVKPYDPMGSFASWLDGDVAIIEQYTGLKDKNGKEIYEGDILQTLGGEVRYIVEWRESDLGYWGRAITDTPDFAMSKTEEHDEVIGNIHENNDLILKETK